MSKQPAQRLPAPSLFVGPPSHNASTSSLTRHNTSPTQQTHPSPTAQPSSTIPGPNSPPLQPSASHTSSTLPTSLSRQTTTASSRAATGQNESTAAAAPVGLGVQSESGSKRQRPRRGTAVLDAHWAALQSTLSDIELSAGSSGHVFGAGHAKALEELRAAQVELARAWGSTDAGDDAEEAQRRDEKPHAGTNAAVGKEDEDRHRLAEHKTRAPSVSSTKGADLTEAARRRETSDKYFAQVKSGVQEVVRKLDAVSSAMRAVEMQSRDIWGEGPASSSEGTDFGSLSS